VPVIGDPLTLVAGVMREPLRTFVPLVAFAKLARYLVVAAVALRWV
jgi:membrane protein YqaA with SNARE-associated domain